MSDLSSLMQYAPTVAGGYIGTNQAQQELMEKLKQMELQQLVSSRTQDQQFNAQKQPFELDRLGLANETSRAQMPGMIADSSIKQTTATKNAATMQSDIDTHNTDNAMKNYATIGNHLGSLSDAITDNPNVPPHTAMVNTLKGLGLGDAQTSALMGRYATVPPAELQKRLLQDSQRILRETPAYSQAYDTMGATNDMHRDVAGMQGRSAEQVALINERARVAAAQERTAGRIVTLDQGIRSAKTAAERYQKLNDAASEMDIAGNKEAADNYRTRAVAIYPQAKAEIDSKAKGAGSIDAGSVTGLPTTDAPDIRPPGFGGVGAATAVQAPPAAAIAHLKSNPQLRAAFDAKYGAGAAKAALGN